MLDRIQERFTRLMFRMVFIADTPLGQVKLGELMAWFGRRNKSPQAAVSAISRGESCSGYMVMLAKGCEEEGLIMFVHLCYRLVEVAA